MSNQGTNRSQSSRPQRAPRDSRDESTSRQARAPRHARPSSEAQHARVQQAPRSQDSQRRRSQQAQRSPQAQRSRDTQRSRPRQAARSQAPRQQRSQQAQRRRPQAAAPRRSPLYLRILLIVLLLALVALIVFAISRCAGSTDDSNTGGRSAQSQSVSDKTAGQAGAGVILTSASMQRIPDDDGVFTFSLGLNASGPALDDAHRTAIADAYDALTEYDASASFLFIDLQTGKGIGCNIDEPIYAASAVKGLYACYLAEGQVDAGRAAWSDEFPEGMASGFMDENGEYLNDDVYEYSLERLVEDSVVRSDNDAYRLLRVVFDGDEYVDWLNSAGVDGDDWRFTDWWTNYSAREAAALWLHTRDYIASDSGSASKLQGWLRTTDVSMIRNALLSTHETGYKLLSKAGWNADAEQVQFNALGDAGIISHDGKEYLIVVLSSYPGDEDNFYLAEDLISALWNARGDLAA